MDEPEVVPEVELVWRRHVVHIEVIYECSSVSCLQRNHEFFDSLSTPGPEFFDVSELIQVCQVLSVLSAGHMRVIKSTHHWLQFLGVVCLIHACAQTSKLGNQF